MPYTGSPENVASESGRRRRRSKQTRLGRLEIATNRLQGLAVNPDMFLSIVGLRYHYDSYDRCPGYSVCWTARCCGSLHAGGFLPGKEGPAVRVSRRVACKTPCLCAASLREEECESRARTSGKVQGPESSRRFVSGSPGGRKKVFISFTSWGRWHRRRQEDRSLVVFLSYQLARCLEGCRSSGGLSLGHRGSK